MDLFAGTASYYDQFRPGVPEETLDCILKYVAVPVTLLDLGSGTGRVVEQFAPFFSDIIGIEPDRAMAKLARERLQSFSAHIQETNAEDMQLPDDWQASLVTIVRAFHWMDRAIVLHKLEPVVAQNGVIAVLNDRSFWHIDEPWSVAVRTVIQEFLGSERKTVQGVYQRPPHAFSQDLAASVFSHVDKHILPLTRHWNADQIVGYLYSTSFASKALLGTRAERFEAAIRRTLLGLSRTDDFVETNEIELFVARRPSASI